MTLSGTGTTGAPDSTGGGLEAQDAKKRLSASAAARLIIATPVATT
jgi:hypothetical protein